MSNNAEEEDKRDREAYENEKRRHRDTYGPGKAFRPYLQNPFRTGGWVLVSEEYVTRVMQPKELVDHLLKCRVAFIPDEAWDKLGLPRGAAKEKTNVSQAEQDGEEVAGGPGVGDQQGPGDESVPSEGAD